MRKTKKNWTDVLTGRRYLRRRAVLRALEDLLHELVLQERAARRACLVRQRRHHRRRYSPHGYARSIHVFPDPPGEEFM